MLANPAAVARLSLLRPAARHGGRSGTDAPLGQNYRLAFRAPRGQLDPQRIPPLRAEVIEPARRVMAVPGDVIPPLPGEVIAPACILRHQYRTPCGLECTRGGCTDADAIPRHQDVLRPRRHRRTGDDLVAVKPESPRKRLDPLRHGEPKVQICLFHPTSPLESTSGQTLRCN